MDAEIKTLSKNDAWNIVDEIINCDMIDSKWVLKISKLDEKGKSSLFKYRVVAVSY